MIYHRAKSSEHEELQVVTVFEEGINKEEIKQINRNTKRYDTLIKKGQSYTYLKNA